MRRSGKSYAAPLVVLVTAPNPGAHVRIGVVAGQRVGGAVQRNRAKRQIRAVAHSLLPSITPGWDLILIARQPITQASYSEIEKTITGLVRKARVFHMDGDGSVFTSGLSQ